ncbi:uncharacterized protein LOC136080033 isoform X1 [Hydra vulgaris]|uniref:uncharacterized protein LOC136080033 isoform X1 n=1 Tax=Hydra vulgaris TaxID=6087 RepID=UPI0032E9CDB8
MDFLSKCLFLLYAVLPSETAPLPQVSIGCESGKFYSDPENCSKFFLCDSGRKFSLSCPPSLFWDNTKTACLPTKGLCQISSLLTSPPTNTEVKPFQVKTSEINATDRLTLTTELPQVTFQPINEVISTPAIEPFPVTSAISSETELIILATEAVQTTIQLTDELVSTESIPPTTAASETISLLTDSPKETIQLNNDLISTELDLIAGAASETEQYIPITESQNKNVQLVDEVFSNSATEFDSDAVVSDSELLPTESPQTAVELLDELDSQFA